MHFVHGDFEYHHYVKLNISFSLVPVYAMLCAFPVENAEIIEPYPNIEASALAGCGAYGVDV